MDETGQATMMHEAKELSPKAIAECCEKGDELAIEVFRRTGEILGLGLANVASIWIQRRLFWLTNQQKCSSG